MARGFVETAPSPSHASTSSQSSTTLADAAAFSAPPRTPAHVWVAQAVRNLLMDPEDVGKLVRVRLLIRDRDAKYPTLIDMILGGVGITRVRAGVRISRTNAIVERWVKMLRAELLERTLIWNERPLRHVLREYERHATLRRPDRSLATAAPPTSPAPAPAP